MPKEWIAVTDAILSRKRSGGVSILRGYAPYEFQDLSAAVLRAMEYYTPLVAPLGKDGGFDIIAYRHALGTQQPRIKMQIKHRETATPVAEVSHGHYDLHEAE